MGKGLSLNILEIAKKVKKLEEAGGGGTSNYNQLSHKPSINGVTLSGNKTASDLGLQEELTFDEPKSVSGNPITLTDGSARNAEGLAVTCNPKQNLHGYDHPWAGGAGKNKFDINKVTGQGATVSISDDVMTITGTASVGRATLSGTNISYDAESTYTLSFTIDSISGYASQPLFFGFAIKKSNNTYRYVTVAGINTIGDKHVSVTLTEGETLNRIDFNINDAATALDNPCTFVISNIQLEKGSTATTFAPYSNECPITGLTECVVEVKDEEETTQHTATITFGQTVYGCNVGFKTGKVTVTHASIASYNGETINEPWLSSIDEYVSGSTPTTGAQVVYPLTTPIELTLTPAELELLKGYNYITTNGTTIALDYLPDNPLLELKDYVDSKMPPAPSSDGTYNLTVTVVSGTATYNWTSI